MDPRRRATFVLSIIAATTLLAACGTSNGSTPPGESSAAQGTPGAATTPAPGATLGNIGGAASGLSNLSSYKVTMSGSGGATAFDVELIKINGANPAVSFTETSGSVVVFRVIEIGTDNWVDQGSGFVKNSVPNSSLEGMMGAFDPGTIFHNASTNADLSALENKGIESKNGVQAVHLHGDQNTQVPAGASPIPAGATIDLWVAADGGYLVALEVVGMTSASGGLANFTIEVTNINDSSLTVTAPS